MNIAMIEESIARIKDLGARIEEARKEEKKWKETVEGLTREMEALRRQIATQLKDILPAKVTPVRRSRRTTGSGETMATAVIEALSGGETVKTKQIQAAIEAKGMNPASLPVTLNRLIRDGKITREGRGVYKLMPVAPA